MSRLRKADHEYAKGGEPSPDHNKQSFDRPFFCGVGYEIRSLKRNVLDISTSSGERSEQIIEEGEEI